MATTGSTSSSMTSTSHTLTAFPPPSKVPAPSGPPMADLLEVLAPQNRHLFITPSEELVSSSLALAKETLDAFAAKVGEEQAQRLREARRKRKRGERDVAVAEREVLRIRQVHVEGFEVEQVWEQARRVIDALRGEAEVTLGELDVEIERDEEEERGDGSSGVELLKFDEDGFEIGSDDVGEGVEEDEDEDEEDEGAEEREGGNGVDEEEITGEDVEGFDAPGEENDYNEEDEEEGPDENGVFIQDPHMLNDGFFSIDDFNKRTEFLERQDAAAGPYTGEASDEEEIDWDVDPTSMLLKPASTSNRAATKEFEDAEDEDMEDDEDNDDGPTFGNIDLNAPEGESDDDGEIQQHMDEEGDNTNAVYYKDFFEPPPRKAGKGERQANYLDRQSRKPKAAEPGEDEADVERAMADVRRDLFDEESDKDNSEEALSELDPSDPKSRRSAHERRQARLAEEIRKLEAASVAKREWTMSGEARAADRPFNSLIEQDLDFEHAGKPIPVITAEVSESMEELIKQRILARNFDEPVRRRPDSLNGAGNTRRGLFELDDTKPQQSLAELYEEEHVKANNPDTYVSITDEKMRKEEKEIEGLWKEVSAKLDALSSWHYKPKPAAPSLTVVADIATVSMEDAQPTTASGISGGDSMLAPQEIYKPGESKEAIEKREVVPKSGAPVSRQEMTREEKLRRRRREKERIRKRGGLESKNRPEGKNAKAKKETLGDLKKGGVKVIGRKGDIRDVDGNKIKAGTAFNGAGGFKL